MTLTLDSLVFLRTPAGARLLAEAGEIEAAAGSFLQALTHLRRRHPAHLAGAALETVVLRRSAARKFSRAGAMFFTRDGLEQATGEAVARHSALRFAPFEAVADLCCGIGGDTIALAGVTRVVAIDLDPVRLAIARANCEAYDRAANVEFRQGDAITEPLNGLAAAFCDPGRRDNGRRVFDVDAYQPPLSVVMALKERIPALGIKVAPGIRDSDLPANCEVEFIQDRGDLKQATLWFGALQTANRRGTLLPGGATVSTEAAPPIGVTEPRSILYEPEPAVIRAHAIQQLGHDLDATQLDLTTAFLTADGPRSTPFARAYRIDEWLPFNLKALRHRLRELDVGTVVVKKRGSPLDPQELERMLRLEGHGSRTLVLTHVRGRHSVLICRSAEDRVDSCWPET